MRVLVVCETSGRVREAFRAKGHEVWSIDLLPSEDDSSFHIIGDARNGILNDSWDMMIAHPDCTYLTCSAEWAYTDGPYHMKLKPGTLVGEARRGARRESLDFVRLLFAAKSKKKVIENPRGVISTAIRPASQYIQPFDFGEDASKTTGLWLENLPNLTPTEWVQPRMVCPGCRGVFTPCNHSYDLVLLNGCILCGQVEAGLMRPRWANQTDSGQNRLTPGPDRWKERARTYQGIVDAMANQWG